MKKITPSTILKAYLVLFCLILCACKAARTTQTISDLPRADSRYIGWLEKESIFNASPEKIKIVSGTQFAWNFSSSKHDKHNILAVTPLWLQINPFRLKYKDQTPLKTINNNNRLLKKAQISGLYLYPNKNAGFENVYSFENTEGAEQRSPVSLSISTDIGTEKEYYALGANAVQAAGNILPLSLGAGSDFLLALRNVREYAGLFMMLEIPKELWSVLPAQTNENSFSPSALSKEQFQQLKEAGLIPNHFYRDFFDGFPKSGFAASNEILGYDGVTRRWLYRYVNSPYTPVLNVYDPSFQTQRMLQASIIQEIGMLKQGLVSVSVQDVWGQESIENSAARQNISSLKNHYPALSVLETINRAVHGYGAWTFCRDNFPPDHIRLLQNAQTDFAADTLLMPALEQALSQEKNTPLLQAFQVLQEQKIDEQSLWHGTQSCFSFSPYAYPALTQFILEKTNITKQECSILKKMLESPILRENNPKLNKKLLHAQKMQTLFLGFQSLLPGLNIIHMEDLTGAANKQEKHSPFSRDLQQDALLFGTLAEQISHKESPLHQLQNIWKIRQEKQLHSAQLCSVAPTQNPKTFAFVSETPRKQKMLLAINLSASSQPIKITAQKKFSIPKTERTLQPYELYYVFF